MPVNQQRVVLAHQEFPQSGVGPEKEPRQEEEQRHDPHGRQSRRHVALLGEKIAIDGDDQDDANALEQVDVGDSRFFARLG